MYSKNSSRMSSVSSKEIDGCREEHYAIKMVRWSCWNGIQHWSLGFAHSHEMRVSPAMRCGRKTHAWCMAMLVAAWVIFLMSCGVGQCLACVLHYMYTHSRHTCACDFVLCCLCVATWCIFVYVYTFVNTQRMSILSPASLRHSIRYIG